MENTVFIVEDDDDVRAALTSLVKSVDLPVESYANPKEFLNTFDIDRHGCLVFDVRMPGMSGLHLYDELRNRHAKLPVIFITGHGDIPMAVRAMKSGAYDFIVKPFNNQMLLDRIQQAIFSQKGEDKTQENFSKLLKTLTARETEILEKIVNGKLSKEISYELHIALSTVEQHRSSIMQKLQVKNIAELIKNYLLNKNS